MIEAIFIRSTTGQPIEENKLIMEEVTDPEVIARHKTALEHYQRNSDWLQSHRPEVLPQARGKFLAIAGQEAFIADTPEQAWAWARSAHPEDRGPVVQYVRLEQGPRIYAYRG
jgi:hypothetical protein